MKKEYLLKDISIRNKKILIAGISKNNTIDILQSKAKQGEFFKAKVIDICGNLISEYKEKFKNDSDSLEFIAADLCDVSFIKEVSLDYVILPSTLSSINIRPLKVIQAFKEVYRILKDDGLVIIQEKMATANNNRPEYSFYNWYRSRKNLLGNLFSDYYIPLKPHFFLNDLKFALKEYKFNIENILPQGGDTISDEKKEELLNDLLPKNIDKESSFDKIISIVKNEFSELKERQSFFPPYSIIKCTKKKS